ncbi:helix-hairpin-helix domain-containing protein [Alkalibacillus silvisoli]|uniref:Helix-hairpin-helix domain-containing protein n=1 Tax=Alkalibacillus silvisoli TaxID=392823 RepID=A0ABP3JL43_9BACI
MLIPKKWIIVVIIIFMIVMVVILQSNQQDKVTDYLNGIESEALMEPDQNLEMLEFELEEEEEVVWAVDVKGEVKETGVISVEAGKRVVDVIELAGGFTEDADTNHVNLAELVYDEMVIYVPNLKEGESVPHSNLEANNQIRVNSATIDELTSLPGIGEQRAKTIIDYREEHGPFSNVEDLLNISGIGEKTLENFKDDVVIP